MSRNSSNNGDIYEAMAFAARLPNRPAVGKVMIAMTCDTVTSGWNYGDSMTMLTENLIKLHYINPKKLSLKFRNKKLKTMIYGYNKNSVFTIKNLNNPNGDPSYRNLLKIPKVNQIFCFINNNSNSRITFQPWLLNQEDQFSPKNHCKMIMRIAKLLHLYLAE